jgi:predicted house-cleaning noncanonical NTP pyrophosphatase (MazG superfamily)
MEELGAVCKILRDKTKEALADLFSNLDSIYDWSDIASLLKAIMEAPSDYDLNISDYLDKTLTVLPYNLNQVADYRQLAEICRDHSQAFAQLEENFREYAKHLEEGLEDELRYISSVDDIGTLEECAEDIQRVANVFKVDLSNSLSQVQELIQDLEQEHEIEEEKPIRRHIYSPMADDPELIASMFDTLN